MVEGEQRKEEMLKIVIKNRGGAKIGKRMQGHFFSSNRRKFGSEMLQNQSKYQS
jgi:hypothetical protein